MKTKILDAIKAHVGGIKLKALKKIVLSSEFDSIAEQVEEKKMFKVSYDALLYKEKIQEDLNGLVTLTDQGSACNDAALSKENGGNQEKEGEEKEERRKKKGKRSQREKDERSTEVEIDTDTATGSTTAATDQTLKWKQSFEEEKKEGSWYDEKAAKKKRKERGNNKGDRKKPTKEDKNIFGDDKPAKNQKNKNENNNQNK